MEPTDNTDLAFVLWLDEVSALCLKKFGLSLSDLPDLATRDAFEAGEAPADFFNEEVLTLMREEFGPAVDDVLADSK